MDCNKALAMAAGMMLVLVPPTSAGAEGADDRGVAEALVQQLERDGAHKAVLADALRNAQDALERAKRMHAAGDDGHARGAEGLAREWAETGRDLARAAQAEATAADLSQKALDAQAKLERERALVEEGLARVGRLTAELNHAREPTRQAVEVHDGDLPKKPPTKGADKPPVHPQGERPQQGQQERKPAKAAAATRGMP
jgi:hypothetical protein